MGKLQIIYSSTSLREIFAKKALEYARKNVEICQSLGLTGRVFGDGQNALAVIEGDEPIMREYFAMVEADKYVISFILHSERKIQKSEFSDYQVLVGFPSDNGWNETVRPLTAQEVDFHITPNLSTPVRLVASSMLGSVIKLDNQNIEKVA